MEAILLVEDRAELREMLATALARMSYDVTGVPNGTQALSALQQRRFALVLTDLKLPSGSGMEVLKAALETDASLPVIIMTAYGSIAEAVAAMREGAYDFIQKPIDLEHLRHLIARGIERQQLLRENIVLREEYARRFGFPRIIGDHPLMQRAAREMQHVATVDSTVLLLGESGTGKELFARAIHQLSSRSAGPFVAVNCAAIPDGLVENELFGHEKGAFTGANARKLGKFELAHSGTLFLDEIGELAAGVQGKLLRALEEHTIERLGGTGTIHANVRVVAATNRDLQAAADAGDFRRDLYFRLAVCPIVIPALRERGDDVLVIAEHLLERFRREMRKPRLSLSDSAKAALRAHTWPGNVRELQNVLERAAILSDGELGPGDLGLTRQTRAVAASAPPPTAKDSERASLEAILRECKWNKAAAAERLGISYKTLLNKIHAYHLD